MRNSTQAVIQVQDRTTDSEAVRQQSYPLHHHATPSKRQNSPEWHNRKVLHSNPDDATVQERITVRVGGIILLSLLTIKAKPTNHRLLCAHVYRRGWIARSTVSSVVM